MRGKCFAMWVNNKNGVLNISRSDNYVVITFTNYAPCAAYKKIDIDKITDALKLYNTRYDIMIESYLRIFAKIITLIAKVNKYINISILRTHIFYF